MDHNLELSDETRSVVEEQREDREAAERAVAELDQAYREQAHRERDGFESVTLR